MKIIPYWKRTTAILLATCTMLPPVSGAMMFDASAYEFRGDYQQKNIPGKPENGVTKDQPFIKGVTGGSDNFRIPALVTLPDGTIVASADARWDHRGDACSLDTLVSISRDNGKTWNYTFANYFQDSIDAKQSRATAFIDPLMTVGKDGTIYLLVDLFPGGIALNTAPSQPDKATGYEEIDGVERLVLYDKKVGQNSENYTHYVGGFHEGFAKIYAKGEKIPPGAYRIEDDAEYTLVVDESIKMQTPTYVDEYYNLYDQDKQPMYCQQLGSEKMVQQNVFYYNADLHVRNATYLWLVTSKDGLNWSAPTILNPQIRDKDNPHQFYGVGPGAGICMDDGTIVMPCYTFTAGAPNNAAQKASFIYSRDNGKTWERSQDCTTGSHWSSESAVVQIDGNTIRQFYRDGYATLWYTDHTWNSELGTWSAGRPTDTGVKKTGNNQLSAIKYSKMIDGKPAILVSTAASEGYTRANGVIYTFLLNDDGSMELAYTYSVTKGSYAYSSLAELADGSIGLLYENNANNGEITYENIPIWDIVSGGSINGEREIAVPLYQSYKDKVKSPGPKPEEIAQANPDIVDIQLSRAEDGDVIVTYTGLREGTTKFISNGITHNITVTAGQVTNLSLEVGEERRIHVDVDTISYMPNSSIVKARIETLESAFNETQINLGKDANFVGERVALSKALYTFDKTDDGDRTYIISSQNSDGEKVYLNPGHKGNGAGYPGSSTEDIITVSEAGQGLFYLQDSTHYLWFWRDGKNHFDRSSRSSEACTFALYRPVENSEQSSEELPGYVRLNSLNDIVSGKQYIIVAQVGEEQFVLYPSLKKDTAYRHAAKVSKERSEYLHTLVLKGISEGITDLMVDNMIYRVNVFDESSSSDSSGGGSSSGGSSSGSSGGSSSGNSSSSNKPSDNKPNKPVEPQKPVQPPVQPPVKPPVQPSKNSVNPEKFEDISDKDWYYPAVKTMCEMGLMKGISETSFAPQAKTTRAMLIQMLFRLNGEEHWQGSVTTSFTDVAPDSWYGPAVSWAEKNGIAGGVSDGKFAPDGVLSREQIAVMLYRASQGKGNDKKQGLDSFNDKDSVSSWATDAMEWAVGIGIFVGRDGKTLAPKAPATRAEVAQIMANYINLIK